jgi:hypothetical protein
MSQGESAAESATPFVIGIYGVGNPPKGEIETAIKSALSGVAECDVRELPWNESVVKPAVDSAGGFESIKELVRELAVASALRFDPRHSSLVDSTLIRVREAAFNVSELLIAVGAALIVVTPPLAKTIAIVASADYGDLRVTVRLVPMLLFLARYLVTAEIVFATACVALAMVRRSWDPLTTGARRIMIVNFRPLLLAVFTPLLLPWPPLFKNTPDNPVGLRVGLFILVAQFLAMPLLWLFVPSAEYSVAFMLLAAGIVVVGAAAQALLGRPLSAVLKVLLDVFRYTARPAYRGRIQAMLDQLVSSMPDRSSRGVVIVAHSLGSVIAVHSLCRSAVWRSDDKVALITFGSPLRRFFFRFFPHLFFPDTADDCAVLIARRLGAFRWINCYRPFDYIGTSIRLSTTGWTQEIETNQVGRLIESHTGYWTDETVRTSVLDAYARLHATPKEDLPQSTWARSLHVIHADHRAFLQPALRRLLIGAALLAPMVGAGVGVAQSRALHQKNLARLRDTVTNGVVTKGVVSHWRVIHVTATKDGASAYVENWYTVNYNDGAGVPRGWKGQVPRWSSLGDRATWLFSERALEPVERARCDNDSPTEDRPCVLHDVDIRFSRTDPDYFVLDDARPSISIENWLTTLWNYGVRALLVGVLFAFALGAAYGLLSALVSTMSLDDDSLADAWLPVSPAAPSPAP